MATGATFVVSDATFPRPVGYLTLSDREALVAEFILGGDETASVLNRAARTGPVMTPINAPLYATSWVEVTTHATTEHGFDTKVVAGANVTILAVARSVSGAGATVLATDGLLGIAHTGGVLCAFNSQPGSSAAVADLPAMSSAGWALYAAALPKDGLGKLYKVDNLGAVTSSTAEVPNTSARTAETLKLGVRGTSTGIGVGVQRLAYVAVYNRVLTEPEILAGYATLRDYLATRNVTI